MLRGSCLCGAVRFSVDGELEGGDACHCIQCRKHSGHYFASTDIPKAALKIDGEDQLAWYQSSDRVRRGFWDPMASEKIAVAMGAFDDPTGTRLHMHIFTSEKGDYYEIADGLPRHDR
jgi:hypothetical protein